jgi:hypothetical protein
VQGGRLDRGRRHVVGGEGAKTCEDGDIQMQAYRTTVILTTRWEADKTEKCPRQDINRTSWCRQARPFLFDVYWRMFFTELAARHG